MAFTPTILYEDNHLLAVNKPFCMPSQGDETGDLCVFDWAKEYIRVKYAKPGNVYVALLHRLDRPTGGVLLLAKTSKAAERVSKFFQKQEPKKIYYAITESIPAQNSGDLRHYLKKMADKNIVRAYQKEMDEAKLAILSYQLVNVKGKRALLKVMPLTGRQHQIRVQLNSIGCAIVGDLKYGASAPNEDKSICLFAQSLTIPHPVKKEEMLTIEAPLPTGGPWADFRL
jgi:23S rRNA pseudouridine1911/1915/1917 synthase